MVNRVRSPSNAIVLLGTFGCRFISNPGLHSKKRKLGTRIAIISKCHRKSKKAGSTVKVGSGEYRVGTPEANNPTQAGMSKQIPAAMTMRRRFTSVVITRVEDYFKSGSTVHCRYPNRRQNTDLPHHSFDKPLIAISDILIRFISTGAVRGAMWRSAVRNIIGSAWERPCGKRSKPWWKGSWLIRELVWLPSRRWNLRKTAVRREFWCPWRGATRSASAALRGLRRLPGLFVTKSPTGCTCGALQRFSSNWT